MDEYNETILGLFNEYESTHDAPSNIVDTFVRMSNELLGSQMVDGVHRDLTVDDIVHQSMFENVGAVRTGIEDAHLALCINHVWWEQVNREAQFILLLHELAHVPFLLGEVSDGAPIPGHPPQYWEKLTELYQQTKNNFAFIEAVFGHEMDWDLCDWYFITMADIPNVEFEHETVPERRDALAETLGYDEFDSFKLMADRIDVASEDDDLTVVNLSDIQLEVPPDSELYSQLQTELTLSNGSIESTFESYLFDAPTVVTASDGGYTTVMGETCVALLKRTLGEYQESPSIPVDLIDSDGPE